MVCQAHGSRQSHWISYHSQECFRPQLDPICGTLIIYSDWPVSTARACSRSVHAEGQGRADCSSAEKWQHKSQCLTSFMWTNWVDVHTVVDWPCCKGEHFSAGPHAVLYTTLITNNAWLSEAVFLCSTWLIPTSVHFSSLYLCTHLCRHILLSWSCFLYNNREILTSEHILLVSHLLLPQHRKGSARHLTTPHFKSNRPMAIQMAGSVYHLNNMAAGWERNDLETCIGLLFQSTLQSKVKISQCQSDQ